MALTKDDKKVTLTVRFLRELAAEINRLRLIENANTRSDNIGVILNTIKVVIDSQT